MIRNKLLTAVAALAAIVVVLAYNALFVVQQTEQVLVLQFGEVVRTLSEPGLKVKIPFIQNVVVYEKRIIALDPPVEQVTLSDQKRLVVDTFTRFRISDPLRFYQTASTEARARARLSDIVNSALRRVLGNVTLQALLSPERDAIMGQIRARVDEEAKALGIDVTDVRIRRADLPDETTQAIYARMQSEREREAQEFLAQGKELAQQIRSKANRETVVIIAEAQMKAQVIHGEGDSEAGRIYAEAFQRDPEFYAFYRSLESYRKAFEGGESTMVLSPDSEYFRYFGAGSNPPGR
ncbi:MAG: protease modulator HflC [Alphaproteobacteria bacterium]|nr:protease modulator HflC [Alphaproteobacteria bacterium]